MFENTCTPNPLIKVIPVGYDHCMIKMESIKQANLSVDPHKMEINALSQDSKHNIFDFRYLHLGEYQLFLSFAFLSIL